MSLRYGLGDSDSISSYVGSSGEIGVNTTTNTIHIFDGINPGGTSLAKSSDVGGGSGGGTVGLTIKDENITKGIVNSVTTLNFVGDNVTATASGTISTITVETQTYIQNAGIATYAASSGIATYATTAGVSTTATTAGYATTAGIATVAQGLTGTPNITVGIITATKYYGDGSSLTGITASGSNISILSNGSSIGTATTINFGTNLSATLSSGIATITATGTQWVTTSAGIHTLSNVGIGTTNPTSNIHIGSGTTTISPLQINSGSLLTIPQVGAIEYDGTTFYATPNQTSGRGILSSQSYYRIGNTAITGNTGTSAQNALGVLANVNSSTVYQFEYLLAFSKPTGTNTHNFAFRFLNGTATVNNIFLHRVLFAPLFDGNAYTGAVTSYSAAFTYNSVFQAPLTIFAIVRGTVGIATGGTIGPQYTLSANPGGAYSTISGSYFSICPIGIGTSNISVGQWT